MAPPIRLTESFHPKVWGSRDLEPWYPAPDEKTGEVWFTSDPPPPLLVKFLFTTERLSVQVHPGGPQGKTEMWHILRAGAGAQVAVGFAEPITQEQLRAASVSGEIESLLRWIPVRPGDTIFVPAGTVHAIGAGLAICEIQQYSDVTYRLYDYGRPRELHLEEAVPISDLGRHPGVIPPGADPLVACEYFETRAESITGNREVRGDIVIVLRGSGEIDGLACGPGQAWRIAGRAVLSGSLDVLITRVP